MKNIELGFYNTYVDYDSVSEDYTLKEQENIKALVGELIQTQYDAELEVLKKENAVLEADFAKQRSA